MLATTVGGNVALCAVLLFLTISTVFLRFFARYKQNAKITIDDWLVAVACVFFVGMTSLIFYGISIKFIGHKEPHDKNIVLEQHPTIERLFLSLDGLTVMTLGLTKISALFFYLRLFYRTGIRDTYLIFAFTALVSIWTVVFFVMTFNLCGHHSINWDVQPGNSAKCKLDYPYFEAVTISDFILDVLIISLPLLKIQSLHANIRRKIAISGVFLFALVGLAASTTRMVITIHLVKNGRAINDLDAYQSNTENAYFMILEAGFTIVAVNMPSLWYYIAGVTPERVLRSVRSQVSLSSLSSPVKGSEASDHQAPSDHVVAGTSLDTTLEGDSNKRGETIAVEVLSHGDLGYGHQTVY